MSRTATKTTINWKEILERSQRDHFNTYDVIPMNTSNIEKVLV